jgi:penicillin-binding protein 2
MQFRTRGRKKRQEIYPDEILIDSQNVSEFDKDQFEGRMERPLSRRSLAGAGFLIATVALLLLARAGDLQILNGVAYAKQARENQLQNTVLFADRGAIEDRTGRQLAWNERAQMNAPTENFAARMYATYRGIAHVLGYAKAPAKDSSGFYFRDTFEGVDGAEKAFDPILKGQNGLTLTETDARGKVVSEAAIQLPRQGQKVTLSIDAQVSQGLYDILSKHAQDARAQGAAGVVMNVRTGELLVLTSYPEYSPTAMSDGNSGLIAAYNADKHLPFLDRATDGLYAPGSIVKPLMAAAALTEGVIDEHKQILSTGQISLPNPYDPQTPSVFKDWRVNGWMDIRQAIAVSSDVFFYEVGGGFESQQGLGIARIDQYFKLFGFGSDAGLSGFSEVSGTIPSPEWKAQNFPQDPLWRIGDTYHTAIGQYGTLVTPLQAVRMISTIANGGTLLTPSLVASSTPQGRAVPVDLRALQVAREGMRLGVTEGIATAVNFSFVHVAAKTGTAQVGAHNENQNAWMVGFWPYENPQYAYAVVLEKMPANTPIGGSVVMSDFFNYLEANAPQYLSAGQAGLQ